MCTYMWYICFCLCPFYYFWLNLIWDFKLLDFEVGGYDKIENFLKTILKITTEK